MFFLKIYTQAEERKPSFKKENSEKL